MVFLTVVLRKSVETEAAAKNLYEALKVKLVTQTDVSITASINEALTPVQPTE